MWKTFPALFISFVDQLVGEALQPSLYQMLAFAQ